MTAIRILLVEDDNFTRTTMATALSSLGIDVVYQTSSVSDAINNAKATHPDAAVLDLDLGDRSEPLDNLNRLVNEKIAVIVVSALAKTQTVRHMLRNGAAAYVSKNAESEALRDAIVATINGQQYMSPDIAVALLSDEDVHVNLSKKEQEALAHYASGMKLDEVASAMNISRSTASEYIQRARKKYTKAGINLPTKTDLYRQAQKDGLLK